MKSAFKKRMLGDALESFRGATGIITRFEGKVLVQGNIQSLRTAANQARQAVCSLDGLIGILDSERYKEG